MNTLGKLFIVLIFVMSIMFMSFSVVLYATHTNWKNQTEEKKIALDKVTSELNALKKQKADMETALNLEIQRKEKVIASLTTKASEITDENNKFRDDLAKLEEQVAQQVVAVQKSHEDTEKLRERLDGKSKALWDAQQDWAKMATELIQKTDEAHTLALQVSTYQSVGAKLASDYRDAVEVLKKHGLKPSPDLYSGIPPKDIRGLVTEVRPKGMIEISVGADAGLVKGHRLDVVRHLEGRSSYIGKIEIIKTEADRSAAVILPEFRRGTVQRDDSVEYIDVNELSAQ
jgi:hypothetical protein